MLSFDIEERDRRFYASFHEGGRSMLSFVGEEMWLEIKRLQAENKRMREALERAIENKFEPDKWLFPAQEVLKEEE